MRKNFKKGVKTLTQVSFIELETGHFDLFNAWTDTSRNLDVNPKYLKDFNVIGFDIDVFFGSYAKNESPRLIVAGAGEIAEETIEYLKTATGSDEESWVGLLTDALEKDSSTEVFRSLFESFIGDFVVYIFKDGELFVYSQGKQLRSDNRLNISATALAFSKTNPERALIKIDPITKKLYPVLIL